MSAKEIREQDLAEMSSIIQSKVITEVTNQVQALLTSLETTTLDIAIIGDSGAGKSTFINALQGLGDEDVGAAKTGVTETTTEPTLYKHPKIPTVRLWDLPGIGTPNFLADQYLKKVDFEKYDFFIILASERFRENNAYLAKSIRAMNKKFYFVRSKIDLDIRACQRNKNFNEESVLAQIRAGCICSLQEEGVEAPKVFLVSSFELHKYDFYKLQDTLVQELNGQKRHVLLLSLPNNTAEVVQHKKYSLKRHVWKKALMTCIVSVLPTQPVPCNTPMLMETLTSYQKNFGLDDESLSMLAQNSKVPVLELKKAITSTLGKDLSANRVQAVLNEAASNSSMVASLVASRVPLLSHVISGGVSFVATYSLLNSALDDFAQDAERLLKKACGIEEVEIKSSYDTELFYFD
uniref:Interferon-inducible GTPase 5-like isoform X2 n=1 Tax=Geotrypetes seraphini TaxID=260995 RepID=A0A6P8SK19_GEOSA|nr:interferon-inducible GTPase 5-like isoform X2 [Geotrypetes seraphini]XP_033819192.1 interferon-inducible GTPase 5-like isoform X2 [Geotrypetes seraphini]XP_033819193.1 interferon-inducible GTPase 5-like isoform X2 [Geotrypetes seraphini]XP_033819194.1 interferon-inducible GTPase 5-like isoform X2 [Geotrypetes seraphini]